MRKEPPSQQAFTLLELLAVTAILAVLIALLVPAMQRFLDRASGASCAATMRSLGALLQVARAENNGYFPTGLPGKNLIPLANSGDSNPQAGVNLTKVLREGGYLEKNETPLCPAMRLSAKGIASLANGETAKSRLNKTGSYGMNLLLLQVKPEGLSGCMTKKWV